MQDQKLTGTDFEIGYPAKIRCKLLDEEGWTIRRIHRRGAFERNNALSDSTILGEICGDAGTSGQRFKRSIRLNDKASISSALNDVKECLKTNPTWSAQIAFQLNEARADFPNAIADISVFSPSTGVFTIFFTTSREDGLLYVPTYSITIIEGEDPKRMYAGELAEATDRELSSTRFFRCPNEILLERYRHSLHADHLRRLRGKRCGDIGRLEPGLYEL